MNNNLILNKTLVDTVHIKFRVDKRGVINLDEMKIGENILSYKEIINRSFTSTISNLPKLYPAIKRGQEVDVIFNLPILLSTE